MTFSNPFTAPAAHWLYPDWPLPAGVHALCSTRMGGVSLPPHDSLNLGAHVGDDPAAVRENRLRLQARVQAVSAGARPVFLNQVHGDGVLHLDSRTPDGTDADACVASAPGVVCTIMVADCLPVLLAHRSGTVVAAAHAGWRGLAGVDGHGVLESVVAQVASLVPPPSERTAGSGTLAWLGPCIGPSAFEVGAEVRAAFCDASAAAQACFTPRHGSPGKYLCDLAGLARLRLRALGIADIHGNDSSADWCTVTNPSRFFSHRRDSGVLGSSGRFAACIWRD